jgi:hypothetical protein
MRDIHTLKPERLVDTDKRTVSKDIYYTTFKRGIIWSSVITGAGLLCFILNKCLNWQFPLEIRDVTAIFTGGIIVVTCLYHAKNLRLNTDANQKRLDFDYDKLVYEQAIKQETDTNKSTTEKRLFAFNMCREFVSPVMVANIHRARLFYLTDTLMQEIKTILPADTEAFKSWSKRFDLHPARKSVIMVLNFFEQIAISVNNGFADEPVCRQLLKTVMLQYFTAYRPYIAYRQHDAANGSATFLENFESLAIRWSGGTLKK